MNFSQLGNREKHKHTHLNFHGNFLFHVRAYHRRNFVRLVCLFCVSDCCVICVYVLFFERDIRVSECVVCHIFSEYMLSECRT